VLGSHDLLLYRMVQLLVLKVHHSSHFVWCIHYLLLHVILGVDHLSIMHHWHLGVLLELGADHLASDTWWNNNVTIILIKWPVNLLLVTIEILLLILALAWRKNCSTWLSLREHFLHWLHIALLWLRHIRVLIWWRALAPIPTLLALKHHLVYTSSSLTWQNLIWLLRCAKMVRIRSNHLVNVDHSLSVILHLLHVHSILPRRHTTMLHLGYLCGLD